MCQGNATSQDDEHTCGRPSGARSEGAQTAGCCSPGVTRTAQGCPCGAVFKSHRAAVFAICAAVLLALLISQVGGALGIFAFFRTF